MGPGCGERQLGEQRCETCRTFTRRIGVGGPCPHCDEPVAVTDLLAQAVITHNQAVIPHPVTTHLGPCPRSPQPGRQFRGHRWAETVATSGQVSWPRVGRNRWPLTLLFGRPYRVARSRRPMGIPPWTVPRVRRRRLSPGLVSGSAKGL